MADETRDDFDRWYSALPGTVRKNCKIVTMQDLNVSNVLRIDKDPPKIFTPRLPHSATKKEDHTTPRVSSGWHLYGCLFGYGQYSIDVMDGSDSTIEKFNGYRGGYVLQKTKFDFAVTPSKALVPEVEVSDEVWLVNYNKKTSFYKFQECGRVFLTSLEYLPNSGEYPDMKETYYFEYVSEDKDRIVVYPGCSIDPGQYMLIVTRSYKDAGGGGKFKLHFVCSQISQAEYAQKKKLVADRLGLQSKPVGSRAALSWLGQNR